MTQDGGFRSIQELVAARKSVCTIAEATRKRYEDRPLSNLVEDLKRATDSRQRAVLGLLVADLQADRAATTHNIDDLDSAVFRLGQHFKTLAVTRRADPHERACAVVIARSLLDSLKRPPREAIWELDDAERFLTGVSPSWSSTIALTIEQFNDALTQIQISLSTGVQQSRHLDDDALIKSFASAGNVPSWIHVSDASRGDPYLMSQSPWDNADPAELSGSDIDLARAVAGAVQAGEFDFADRAARALAQRVRRSWAPAPSFEDRSTWRVLRASHHLARLGARASSERRQNALSAYELLEGLHLDEDLVGNLIEIAVENLDPFSPEAKHEWSIAMGRMLSVSDHEAFASGLNNAERAHLRETLADLMNPSIKLIATNLRELSQELRGFRHQVESELRRSNSEIDVYLKWHRRVRSFLLREEAALTDRGELLLRSATAARKVQEPAKKVSALLSLASNVGALADDIRSSGSSFVQELLLPLLDAVKDEIDEAKRQAEQVSRPDLRVTLQSDRLPLRANHTAEITILIDVFNAGNAAALDVATELSSRDANVIEGTGLLGALRAGETTTLRYAVNIKEPVPQLVLRLDSRWTNELGQDFVSSVELMAEAETESRWTPDDVNPYRLAPVRHRERLYGRDQELESLRTRLSAGDSVFVTGQKRVGKSSLVQVALESLGTRGIATQFVSFGYLQAESTGELIENLLLTIRDMLTDVLGDKVPPFPEFDRDRAANVAGRWLKSVSQKLSSELHVVLAIDDFDELPRGFFESEDGASLFIFLRALVGEPWLALVLVGSEIMPNLMRSHGYKLNQVSRLDVGKLAHPEATGRLMREPSVQWLEWSDGAIRRVHMLTGGNPYFSTLLAHEVWDRLRSRDRSFAGEIDVDECAERLAREAEPDHFVHLWADGPAGIDPASDVSTQNAAILFAVARCARDDDSARRDEVIDFAALRSGTESRGLLGGRLNHLIERGVLTNIGDHSVTLDIPFAQSWFSESAGIRLGSQLRALIEATREAAYIADRELLAVSQGLVFDGRPISEIRVRDWLDQFQDASLRTAAWKILRRLKDEAYIDDAVVAGMGGEFRKRLQDSALWKRVKLKANQSSTSNVRIVCPFAHDLAIAQRLATSMKVPKDQVSLVADVIGVGELLKSTGVFLIFTSFDGDRSDVENAVSQLRASTRGLADEPSLGVICLASELDDQSLTVDGVSYVRLLGRHLNSHFRPFSPVDSPIGDGEMVERAREKFESVGKSLNPDFPLGWPPDGLILLFPSYAPTFLPPVFTHSGRYLGNEWKPLFDGGDAWAGSWPKAGSAQERDIRALLRLGRETDKLEFKSSLRTSVPGGVVNKDLEEAVAKAVASFLNAEGGTLLIGVADNGDVLGLAGDYQSSTSISGPDGFDRHLFSVLEKQLEGLVVGDVSISFAHLDVGDICRVECQRAREPVFIKRDNAVLYVRRGIASIPLEGHRLVSYLRSRFP